MQQVQASGSNGGQAYVSQSVQNSGSNHANNNNNNNNNANANGSSGDKKAESADQHPPVTKTRKPYVITKQRERWTPEEHQRFLDALRIFGRQWRKIEEYIGTKTAVQIRSHAQKFFTKIEREGKTGKDGKPNGLAIHIPPPRPKRKPNHPYPKKAKVPKESNKGGEAGKRSGRGGGNVGKSGNGTRSGGAQCNTGKGRQQQQQDAPCLERAASGDGLEPQQFPPQQFLPQALVNNTAGAAQGLLGQNGMMPLKMLENIPYLTWLSSLSGMNKVPQLAMAQGNVVMPTPHKILPGVVPMAGHGYDANELAHMRKLLLNAAEAATGKEERDQALEAARIIQAQMEQAAQHQQAMMQGQLQVLGGSSNSDGKHQQVKQGTSLGCFGTQSAFVAAVGGAVPAGAAGVAKVKVKAEKPNPRGSGGSDNSGGSRTSPMVQERGSDSSGTQGSDGSGSADNLRQMAPKSPSPQEGSLKKGVSPPLTSGNGNSNGSSGNDSNEQQNGTSNNHAQSELQQQQQQQQQRGLGGDGEGKMVSGFRPYKK